jgi:hypothetical protein
VIIVSSTRSANGRNIGLEKLYSYAAWLIRLLPNREVPADIEITEDMMP